MVEVVQMRERERQPGKCRCKWDVKDEGRREGEKWKKKERKGSTQANNMITVLKGREKGRQR